MRLPPIRSWTLLTAVALVACSLPQQAPIAPPGAPGVVPDGETYSGGNHFRVRDVAGLTVAGLSVDSVLSGFPASALTDGDLATQWANAGYLAPTAWAALQLAAPASLGTLAIKMPPSAAGTDYDVQVSQDGTTWNTVLAHQTNRTWQLETKAFPPGTTGQYVRVFWHNSPTSPIPHFSIFEMALSGAAASPTASPTVSPSLSPSPIASPTVSPSLSPSPIASPTPSPSASAAVLGATPVYLASLPGQAVADRGTPTLAVDGDPTTAWGAYGALPAWIAVPLALPATGTLLLDWDTTPFDYLNTGAAPQNYEIQTSVDTTDGRDGTWTTALSVSNNPVRSRVDSFQAPGARWVRLRITSNWNYGPVIRTLNVYEASAPSNLNVWTIMGDSITAQSFDPSAPNACASTVASLLPGDAPIVVAGGTGGDTAAQGLAKLGLALPAFPPGSFVGLAYGTNDATTNVPVATFKAQLQQMIDAIKASGRTPMLARTPHDLNGDLPAYVAAIDELVAANHLAPGPDLYDWFLTHPEEISADSVHPTATGRRSIQRLWGEAIARAYGAR